MDDTGREVLRRIKNVERALKHLDKCKTLTLATYTETFHIAELGMSDAQIKEMWEESALIMPAPGRPGGTAFLKKTLRETLVDALRSFQNQCEGGRV